MAHPDAPILLRETLSHAALSVGMEVSSRVLKLPGESTTVVTPTCPTANSTASPLMTILTGYQSSVVNIVSLVLSTMEVPLSATPISSLLLALL